MGHTPPSVNESFPRESHTVTIEIAHCMKYGCELRLPDQLVYDIPVVTETTRHEYVMAQREGYRWFMTY